MASAYRVSHHWSLFVVLLAALLLAPTAIWLGSGAETHVGTEAASSFTTQSVSSPTGDLIPSAATRERTSLTTSLSAAVPVSAFEGLTFGANGNLTNRFAPPDVQLAVGPAHVVEMVNAIGRISTKDGTALRTFTLATFFGAVSTDFLSDPKVRFDPSSGRWFATLTDVTTSSILLAVSASGDPTATWNRYSFLASAGCADQPLLGMSDDKVVLSANDFSSCTSRPRYAGVEYWVVNKADLVAGSAARFTTIGPNSALFSVQPAHSLGATTTEYLVTAGFGPTSSLTLFGVTGVPPGSVSVSQQSLPIRTTSSPPNAPQLGTKNVLDAGDARVQDAMWEGGRLWLALGVGCVPSGDTGTRACVRLIEVDTASAAVLQDFDVGVAGKSLLYPALRTDGQGHLIVVFGYSSSADYPGIMVAARADGDPPNTIGVPLVIRKGTGPEVTGCSSTVCRYGDYFGAARDPADPGIVWVAAEYGSSSAWATYLAAMASTVRLTLSYSVQGGGSGYEPPTVAYVRGGTTVTAPLSTSPTTITVDAGTPWSVTAVLAGSTAGERWATNQEVSGTAMGSATIAFAYVHQFQASFTYRVVGGGSGSAPPIVTYERFSLGVSSPANVTDWADAGSPYAFPSSLEGLGARERWIADGQSTSGTVSASGLTEVLYRHQAFVTLDVQGPAGSSVSPATGWYDAGASLSLSVAAPSGWAVGRWIGSGPGAYSGTDANPSMIVAGAFNETAILYPSLTITAGFGGSVAYSYDGGSGSVPGGSSQTIYVPTSANVTLVEDASSAFVFAGWHGAASGATASVTLSVTTPTQVTANFTLTQTAAYALYSAIGVVILIAALVVAVFLLRRRRSRPGPPPS